MKTFMFYASDEHGLDPWMKYNPPNMCLYHNQTHDEILDFLMNLENQLENVVYWLCVDEDLEFVYDEETETLDEIEQKWNDFMKDKAILSASEAFQQMSQHVSTCLMYLTK